MSETEFHRVSDMALVAALRVQGHDSQDMTIDDGTVYWIFRATPGVLSIVDSFVAGEVAVEPRAYNKIFMRTKQEMFDFLDASRSATA